MKIPGRVLRPLNYERTSHWVDTLESHVFWKEGKAFDASYDKDHKGLAFFVIGEHGKVAVNGSSHDRGDFDALKAPFTYLMQPKLQPLLEEWHLAHAKVYGSGHLAKVGLYCFQPGGICGYHTDGPVYLDGQRMPVDDPKIWKAIAWTQCTHRTVLPLIVGSDSEFLICGQRQTIFPGHWFEFDNTLPHAFFNRGSHPTVLLVTTYAAHAEIYRDFQWNQ